MSSGIEAWQPVVGYEQTHIVSNMGRVKALARKWKSGMGGIRTKGESLITPIKHNLGYLRVNIHSNGVRRLRPIHRLVAEAFIPNPLKKPEVNHIDGDKTNNRLCNLEWSTLSENRKHAYALGLNPRKFGVLNGGHKDHIKKSTT